MFQNENDLIKICTRINYYLIIIKKNDYILYIDSENI